ncbi:respiratory nitrate reductase subunit gamma [Burkholderiaceae bacterium DAT-1]|nr:respiratory nitrate reductase subunit gamma [Burkholderiaceae bacterium DAT-1]
MAIFLFGSLVRFEREQYTWKSDSSQVLHRGNLRLGNNLFHIGVIGLFFGHLVGLLTPIAIWDALGVTHGFKQMIAMTAGGIFGTTGMIGLLILLHRRLTNARLAAVTKPMDKILLLWILVTLGLGLSTIVESADHLDGHMMTLFMGWAQHILTFRGDAATLISGAPLIFKLHLFMGLSLFVLFPFTRLVHVWSGFGSVTYLARAWQLVRPR